LKQKQCYQHFFLATSSKSIITLIAITFLIFVQNWDFISQGSDDFSVPFHWPESKKKKE